MSKRAEFFDSFEGETVQIGKDAPPNWGSLPGELPLVNDAQIETVLEGWYQEAQRIDLANKLLFTARMFGVRSEGDLPTPHSRPVWSLAIEHVELWAFNSEGLFNVEAQQVDEHHTVLVKLNRTIEQGLQITDFTHLPWWNRPTLFRWRVVNDIMLRHQDGDSFVIVPGVWVSKALEQYKAAVKEAQKRAEAAARKRGAELRASMLSGRSV